MPGKLERLTAAEELAAQLTDRAAALGLAAIGFAPATVMKGARRAIEERKAAGLHGGMEFTYRNPARSTEPSRALPGAVSLVVAAWAYDPPARPGLPGGPVTAGGATRAAPATGGTGRATGAAAATGAPAATGGTARAAGAVGAVAAYAQHDHYADLRAALGELAGVLAVNGWRSRALVDDNALVDRAAAHRAGIGWFGKNCNILLPGRGSWFVLGSLVTDAPLPPSRPVADGCGTCRRCQVACPTGAIVGPGVLDARRCLAWLAQAPGVFPFEYREAMGDRIYGCDDCQSSCPVNRRSPGTRPPSEGRHAAGGRRRSGEGQPGDSSGDIPEVDLLELLSMTDEELLGRYGRWYIPRRDPSYLRRNALVALGNVADGRAPGVERALVQYLRHPAGALQAHAVWAALRAGRADLVDAALAGRPGPLPPEVQDELARRSEVVSRRPT